jgi:hypothetical protein
MGYGESFPIVGFTRESSLNLGFNLQACVLGFIFSVHPAGHPVNRTSRSCLEVCMTSYLMEMEQLIRALLHAKQSLVGSRRFGIPPISGPERVGNWQELVVMIFFRIT